MRADRHPLLLKALRVNSSGFARVVRTLLYLAVEKCVGWSMSIKVGGWGGYMYICTNLK